ncbi:MAG: hypothetical protein PHO26_07715 [Dehalococcoidia bacterium]|nr:hypothetical protein [Dehalococcoidia bacterium]MDD5494742.1 hypothetical protein [Dehalococcoidia bacterium]
MKKIGVLLTVVIFSIFSSTGCEYHGQYETHSNFSRLLDLKGKTVALILYEYNDAPLLSEHFNPAVSQAISKYHKEKFLSEFNSLFTIKDISCDDSLLKGRKPSINQPQFISGILEDTGVEGGFLITNGYGYQMDSFRTCIENYFLISNVYLVDKEGNVIWNFYGKMSANDLTFQSLGEYYKSSINPSNMAKSFLGMVPRSDEEIVQYMGIMTLHYTEYLKWLMEADLSNNSDKGYYQYPLENKRALIVPVEARYVPLVEESR